MPNTYIDRKCQTVALTENVRKIATDGFDVAVVVAIAAFVNCAVVADEPLPSHQLGMPPPSQSQLVHPSLWHFSANILWHHCQYFMASLPMFYGITDTALWHHCQYQKQ